MRGQISHVAELFEAWTNDFAPTWFTGDGIKRNPRQIVNRLLYPSRLLKQHER